MARQPLWAGRAPAGRPGKHRPESPGLIRCAPAKLYKTLTQGQNCTHHRMLSFALIFIQLVKKITETDAPFWDKFLSHQHCQPLRHISWWGKHDLG